MISVSTIIELLEKIPTWKKLSALPQKIEQLEKRIEALESEKRKGSCKGCQKADPLMVLQEKAPPPFGNLGAMIEKYQCPACGLETIKHVDPM